VHSYEDSAGSWVGCARPRRAPRNVADESPVSAPEVGGYRQRNFQLPEADFGPASKSAIECRIRSAVTQAEAAIASATSPRR
jgi:hypothetical protein